MILQNKQANSRPDSHNDDDRNRLLMTMTLPNNARQKVKNEMPQQEEGRTTFMVQRTGPHFPSVATGQCPGRIGGSGEPGVPKGTQGTQGTKGNLGNQPGKSLTRLQLYVPVNDRLLLCLYGVSLQRVLLIMKTTTLVDFH